ncbi:MAG: primosomal protein N' [Bacteroidales bacterium]|nr:primosomal protein N' [Bacteroidales bacterium]
MRYVEVILPLPLDGVFTYSLPDSMTDRLQAGMRVLVPLGRSKHYTGIALRMHDVKPDFEVKEVIAVMDERPLLLPVQLKLWRWMAEYYMAPLGDVYKAALPAGLKQEDGYRPRTETYIGLCEPWRNEQALHVALDMLGRALKQKKVLTEFLHLSRWDSIEGSTPTEDVHEVTREELTNVCHCTDAVVKSLIDRKILYTYQVEVGRLNTSTPAKTTQPKPLSAAQATAYNEMLLQLMAKEVVLLHGVTSSGKTELYIHLIAKTIADGKQVLYLLPEIALTVQMMDRLRSVFGDRLGIYHSKYSDAERAEIWLRQLSDHPYDIILGARSAMFLPFQRLGLVIVDEEHESSYKQQDPAPRYHARSAAIVLAQLCGAKTLLGTATPSAETYYNATTGKYGKVTLATRYSDIRLPEITVVDIKDLKRRKMMTGPFSPQLLAAMRAALSAGKQVILFQNRRGFAPMVECRVCGWVPKCEHCDVSLTYHKNQNRMTCHYCGYTYLVPTRCPNCESTDLKGRGYGTEKIEDQIRDVFPEVEVARMDLDTTRTRNAYERLIGDFAAGRTHVLVGTQMISKGLDFDHVGVVGILDADSMLNYPDFRAYEHAFMMMAQVSGRAGRKGERGQVILQTRNAEARVIGQVVNNDYTGFFDELMEERRLFHYPPYYRLIYIYLRHRREEVVESASIEMGGRLRQWFGERILGPDKPAVARVKSMSVRKIVVKLENGIDHRQARQYLRLAEKQLMENKRYATLQLYFDVDPV